MTIHNILTSNFSVMKKYTKKNIIQSSQKWVYKNIKYGGVMLELVFIIPRV